MHAMNVSRALTSLHSMGLIEPTENSKNRRRKPYRVSTRGAAAYTAITPHISQVARFLFGTLSARERASLQRLLTRLNQRVSEWQPSERRPHVPRA
jgi:DNA-binding MarR family transcriptional regulator